MIPLANSISISVASGTGGSNPVSSRGEFANHRFRWVFATATSSTGPLHPRSDRPHEASGHLSGPIVGGMFAAMHWWRGSFWMMAPLMLVFAGVAYWKIPDRISQEADRNRFRVCPFPVRPHACWRGALLGECDGSALL